MRVGTLDGWLSHTWEQGMQIDRLPDLHALRIATINSAEWSSREDWK